MKHSLRSLKTSILALCIMWSPLALSGWIPDTQIDPQDGMLDASDIARGPEDTSIYLTVGKAW